MKVKIGDTIYSSENQPILLILDKQDKMNIRKMEDKATKFCAFPAKIDIEEIKEWIKDEH